MYYYNPPCSQGPGFKNYTFTIYALSASILDFVNHSDVRMSEDDDGGGMIAPTLVDATSQITLGTATIWTTFELYKKVCVHKGITNC